MKKLTKPHFKPVTSRRDFLANAGSGFGALALGSLLAADGYAAAIKGKIRWPQSRRIFHLKQNR